MRSKWTQRLSSHLWPLLKQTRPGRERGQKKKITVERRGGSERKWKERLIYGLQEKEKKKVDEGEENGSERMICGLEGKRSRMKRRGGSEKMERTKE